MPTISRPIAWVPVLILVGIALTITGRIAAARDDMTDSEKRAQVDELYRSYRRDFPDVQDIQPEEAMRLLQEGKVLFIDVREGKEQAVSMLPSSIPAQEFSQAPDRYRGRVLIGYCTISYRSGKLAQQVATQGTTILNLRGGMLGWVHAGGKG